MATPLSADRLLSALRAEGLKVVEVGTWRTHDRAGHGAWGPVHGVIVHHTVSRGTASSVSLCYDGYDELPGPLCHGVIDKDGVVHLISSGRANHAGLGDGAVLDAVISESRPPRPTANDTDGNARFYGFECVNMGDGSDPWTSAQLDAIERAGAALSRAYGWSAASVIGHKEWTNTKTDPAGFSMDDMRSRIARRLRSAPGKPTTAARPTAGFEPFPGADFFKRSPRSAIITAMGRRLVAEGCSAYTDGPGPQWTDADRDSFRKWQRHLGDAPAYCDGWPGPRQWDALKVPKQ